MLNNKTIDDLLPVFSVENDLLIFKDGRVAVGYRISPLEMETSPPSRYASLNTIWSSATKTLPAGLCLQQLHFYYHKPFRVPLGEQTYFEREGGEKDKRDNYA